MSKKRKKKKKQHLDPDDVLEGRVNVTPYELIRLIHRVNPTNENLGVKKESERYQVKARLQSLLIRNFYDGLLVEQPDPENPQMVSLKLQYFDDDACHALLPELEPDARSWAQRQIDEAASQAGAKTGETGESGTPPTAGLHRQSPGGIHGNDTTAGKKEYSPDELINLGRLALAEYDYETCEDYFHRAFVLSRGSIEAALPMLEFFVDHLGTYKKAIALADSLSASTQKNEDIKMLLALAAVRLGNIEYGLDLLGRVLHPRAPEVYLLGARHFVSRGNIDRVKELQGILKSFELDGLQPEIDQLENDIRGLRLKDLEPVRQEMLSAWQRGEQEKAVKLARQLLEEWPQDKDARRICNEFARQRLTHKLHSLLRRADEAHSKSQFIKEAGLLERAVALDNADDKLKERFKRVQQAAALQQDEAEITETIKSWTAGRKKESLLRFVTLSNKQRREVMNRNQDEHFTWLSRIIPAQSSLKPQKMVEAVLALGESKEILQQGGDPRSVVSGLRLHDKILQSVPEAHDILHRAQEMSKALESAKAKERLKKAGDLAAVEDFQAARECIEQIKVDQLDEDSRKIFADVNEKLKRLEAIHTLKKRYISEANRANHFSGRDIALELAGLTGPDTASHWREKAARHGSQINKEWCLVTGNIEGLPPCYNSYGLIWTADDDNACLLPGGRHILLASTHERWVFLRTFSIPEQEFKQGIMLRAPAAMSFPQVRLARNQVWIAGLNGHAIALTLDPPDILSWHDFSDFVKDDDIIEDVCVFPGQGYLWLNARNIEARGEEICKVINIEQRRVERQFTLKGRPAKIDSGNGCRMIIQDYVSRSIQMFSEQGKTMGSFYMANEGLVAAAAVHPNGGDYVFLPFKAPDEYFSREPTPGDPYEEEDDDFLLSLVKVPDVEGTCRPFIIDDSHGESRHSIHTALDDGLIFVHFSSSIGAESYYYLAAFTTGQHGFEELYRVEAPDKLILAGDELSQKAAAISMGREGARAVLLGRDEPVFPDIIGLPGFCFSLPAFDAFMSCNTPTGAGNTAALAFMEQMRNCSAQEFGDLVLRMKRPGYNGPDKIAAFINALERLFYNELAREMKKWFKEMYPDHPLALIESATDAVQEQKWPAVISLLEKVSLAGLDEGTARHVCHLLGMGLFARGDIKRALETWEAGAAYKEGRCDLDPYITYAEIALMTPKKRKKRMTGKRMAGNNILNTLNVIETIDAHLANREWLEAVSLLETYNVLSSYDLQLLARLTEAFLHVSVVPGERQWFCKIVALATYCERHGKKPMGFSQVFPPYIESWPQLRLHETASRARQWLDSQTETICLPL